MHCIKHNNCIINHVTMFCFKSKPTVYWGSKTYVVGFYYLVDIYS
jgi:hypothetical protein